VARGASWACGMAGAGAGLGLGTTMTTNRVSVENPDDDDDRIYLTRPVTIRDLCLPLGVKPHEMLADLMMRNMFMNPSEPLPDDLAKKLARRHHRVLVIREPH